MTKTFFEYLHWANPKSSALSEEQLFFDENASLFNMPLSRYNDLSSLFGLIRGVIILRSLKNRQELFHRIGLLTEDSLKDPDTLSSLFQGLPAFRFHGQDIYIPTYSPQINARLSSSPWLFKSFPYQALVKDGNLSLSHPFDLYGNVPFSSEFSRLVRLDVRKDDTSVFYHPEFSTLFIIDGQGNLEQEIPLKDEKLGAWPPKDLFDKLVLVSEDYFRQDRTQFLKHLVEYALLSSSLGTELQDAIESRKAKRRKRGQE